MKKKLLPLAMLAGLAGAAGTAQAVHLNTDGLGETLIYPFYSVEGGQDTYISLANTTEFTKAVKVRFIEAENSAEVLDFNLYLSPFDHWSGAIVADGDGAKIITRDNSCTVPMIPQPNEDGEGADGATFRDFVYDGDGGTQGLERTREGYVEVIEMGVILEGTDSANDIVHTPDGVPTDCYTINANWEASGVRLAGVINGNGDPVFGTGVWGGNGTSNPQVDFAAAADYGTLAEAGGLYGYGVLINPVEGSNATYSAVAMDDFFVAGSSQHTNPGNVLPGLGSANPSADILDGASLLSGVAFVDGWDAVSAVISRDTVSNDFVLDTFNNSDTDWVVTMPTKRAYVNGLADSDPANPGAGDDPLTPWNDEEVRPPFTSEWTGSSCEYVGIRAWNREESVTEVVGGIDFSPLPPNVDNSEDLNICTEVSVLSFGEGTAVHPSERIAYGVPGIDYENGWANLDFSADADGNARYFADAAAANFFVGLPMVGFAVQKYSNPDLAGENGAFYSGLIEHKYTRNIVQADPEAGDNYPVAP